MQILIYYTPACLTRQTKSVTVFSLGFLALVQTRERANKFEKFVEDNEGKRRRALKKYQLAKQQNHLKEIEKEELAELLDRLQAR